MAAARREEHERSRRRLGLHRDVVSLMATLRGDFVAPYHEADDLARMFRDFATSQDPHDVWFRDKMIEFHGLTPEMLQGRGENRGEARTSDTE